MLLHLRRSFLMKPVLARTYLSSGYNCADSWNKRLSTPILEKIKLEEFYVDIEQKFQQQRKTSAIDVDIFVNRVTDGNHVDEIADLVHKLRLTEEASSILDSTSHALIRSYVENDHIPFLLQILRDPLNYGIFLDTFTANLALDKLIELKDFNSAAQIASFLMLQEDFGNDITKAMCLYACVKYLENPDPFVKEEVVAITEEAEKKPVTKAKKGKKEENRVRVKFLRNEFFDDHFDLKLPRHLIGKTLQLLSKECPKSVQKSVEILGLCLFDKYDQCLKVIQQLDKNVEIHQDILELCKNILAETPSENESYKLLLDAFNSFGVALVKRSFEEDSLSLLKTSIEKNASQDIEAQKQVK